MKEIVVTYLSKDGVHEITRIREFKSGICGYNFNEILQTLRVWSDKEFLVIPTHRLLSLEAVE